MVGAKMWARRMMVAIAVVGFGCAMSAVGYQAAGAAPSLGSIAFAR